MEVHDIGKAKSEFAKEIKCNGKRFLIFWFLTMSSTMLGSLMFFYVEECYFKVQEPPQYGKRCLELCEQIMKINHTNLNLTGTETEDQLRNITRQCMDKENCIEVEGNSATNCEIDYFHFQKWNQFVFTIIYTIGIEKLKRFLTRTSKFWHRLGCS